MDSFTLLAHGFAVAFQPFNLLYALIGVTLGTAVGVLPGIGPALTVALLLPVTYKLDPAGSLIMFAGIYYGGMYGGSTTSIFLNTPGESASIVTALEGNKMARAGRGGPALATAAIGSFVAGLIATMALALIAPTIVKFALSFGEAEYFALMMLAFMTVSAAFGDSTLRGLTALFIGLALGLIGADGLSGQVRLGFGIPDLTDGVEITTLAVALFAIGETLSVAASKSTGEGKIEPVKGSVWMNREDWSRSWKPWLRGTFIGFPIGAMPAGGAEIGTFLSYSVEKQLSKKPEEFGHGAIEGVAGPEAANNASAAGTLVPLLTLGLPTSATAAIMLAGIPAVRPAARPAVVCNQPAAGLGFDRQPARGQFHVAGSEFAAGRIMGPVAVHPKTLALRRHPGLCDARNHRRQSLDIRVRNVAAVWPARLFPAAFWLSDCARGRGSHSRTHGGDTFPPRPADQSG